MDLRQLKFFLEVAKCESFTKAAEYLHIAQPALSISIKKLEEELDVVLFNRRDRKITLTPEGEALARHARQIQHDVDRARQEIEEMKGLLKGEVRVGLTPMLSSFFFPRIVSAFQRRHPRLRISIHGDSGLSIQRKIESGEIDMGVIAGDIPGTLESHHLVREEIVGCVGRTHRFAGQRKMPFRDLAGEPLIQYEEGYHLREVIDDLAIKEGLSPNVVAESNLYSLIKSLVKEELGIAFFLKGVVAQDPDLKAISCDPPVVLDLSVAWKKNARLSKANRAFVDFLMMEVDEYYLLTQVAGTFPLP